MPASSGAGDAGGGLRCIRMDPSPRDPFQQAAGASGEPRLNSGPSSRSTFWLGAASRRQFEEL